MKLNRTYYVWIDPTHGDILNYWTSKREAKAWYGDPWCKPKLKLKKIKIVEVKHTSKE